MSLSSLALIIVFLMFCTAFASATEMAIASANRIRFKARAEDDDVKAKKIYRLIENRNHVITTIVVLNNIVNILIPTISTLLFVEVFGAYGVPISAILMTILILVFGEILPKMYGSRRSESYLYSMVSLISFVIKLIYPIAYPFIKLNKFVESRLIKRDEEADNQFVEVEEEILTMIEESSLEGKIEENEEELIRNAIEFNDIRVEEILQPKRNVFMINTMETNRDIFSQITEMRYSRIPVYEEDKDHIIGMISERDFLTHYIENKEFDIRTIIRDVKFIPDTMKISTLLPQLQNTKSHIAVVIDERATVQGIVTVEDIIEELVGEIWDEHDDVVLDFRKIDEMTYEVSGELTINDFNDLYEIKDIESEQSESTIAGYVIELAQKIPVLGEIYEDNNFTYEISHVDGNKVEKMIIKAKEVDHDQDEE